MLYRKLLLATAAVCMFGASAYAANSITVTQVGFVNSSTTSQTGGLNTLSATQVGNQNGITFTQVGFVNAAATNQYGFGYHANNTVNGGQLGWLNIYNGMQCTNGGC